MPLSIAEYADVLHGRDLIWPKVPAPIPLKARPSIAPIKGIKVVLWDCYGTLLRTPEGKFTLFPEPEIRLQVALEKTIHEFNMWNSMYRKPGPPWQSMINQYRDYSERLAMVAPKRKGDVTDVNLVAVWAQIVDRLFDKEYKYDASMYGDLGPLSEKIAYFFHCNLQATEARPYALQAIQDLSANGIRQGILADGQSFSLAQIQQALAKQGILPPIHEVFPANNNVFSHQLGVRKPSPSLFDYALLQLDKLGISASEVLHISCRLKTDLVPAKAAGMKTALLASEKTGLEAPAELIKDPRTCPDRLLTDITQITSVVEPR